jgi:uncharacterized protein (UPF0264 family)
MLGFKSAPSDGYEDRIRKILASEREVFAESQIEEVEEFLRAHEYGLALETLAGIITDDHVEVSDSVVRQIRTIAEAMSAEIQQSVDLVFQQRNKHWPQIAPKLKV